jgi:hypothetical protein
MEQDRLGAASLREEFEAWKASADGNDWIVWAGVDESKGKLTLVLIRDGVIHDDAEKQAEEEGEQVVGEELELLYPDGEPDSVWFIEPKRTVIRTSSSGLYIRRCLTDWMIVNMISLPS